MEEQPSDGLHATFSEGRLIRETAGAMVALRNRSAHPTTSGVVVCPTRRSIDHVKKQSPVKNSPRASCNTEVGLRLSRKLSIARARDYDTDECGDAIVGT